MSVSNPSPLSVPATVVAAGRRLSLLVSTPVLGDRKACRVRAMIENATCSGFGVSLGSDTVLLVIDAPDSLAQRTIGATIMVAAIRAIETSMAFERVRERLTLLVDVPSVESLSDRAARHALLYVLEAHDPEVRRQRLDILRASLAGRQAFDGSGHRDDESN